MTFILTGTEGVILECPSLKNLPHNTTLRYINLHIQNYQMRLGQAQYAVFFYRGDKGTIIHSHFIFTTSPSTVMQVPTSKPERDASVLQATSLWEDVVELAYSDLGFMTLDDQMVSPPKRCMISF